MDSLGQQQMRQLVRERKALAEDYIGESKAAELLSLPLTQFHRIRQMDATVEQAHAGVHQ